MVYSFFKTSNSGNGAPFLVFVFLCCFVFVYCSVLSTFSLIYCSVLLRRRPGFTVLCSLRLFCVVVFLYCSVLSPFSLIYCSVLSIGLSSKMHDVLGVFEAWSAMDFVLGDGVFYLFCCHRATGIQN